MADRTHVPDKLQGYLLQVRHMLYELISHEMNRVVSVEAYDDLAVEEDEMITAEQIKSVSSANNPLANRAPVFWKTLHNWCKYIKSSSLPNKTLICKYVIVADRDVQIGSVPQSFADATTLDKAEAAFRNAKDEIYGTKENSKTISAACKPYSDYFFSSGNHTFALGVIQAFSIDVHSNSYDDDLRNRFNSQPIPLEYAEELLIYMLGWVTEKVQGQTQKNTPAFITTREYLDALRCQVRGKDVNKILSAISTCPTNETMSAEVDRRDVYIKQLDLINTEPTEIFAAASDFLRASFERTEWAKRGLVTSQSFNDYYDRLKRTWLREKRLIELDSSEDEDSNGKRLYYRCDNAAKDQRLQGNDVPAFFGSGCLHTLANTPSDCPQIGWHPRYIELLTAKGAYDGQHK